MRFECRRISIRPECYSGGISTDRCSCRQPVVVRSLQRRWNHHHTTNAGVSHANRQNCAQKSRNPTWSSAAKSQSQDLCDYQKVDLNQRLLIADRKNQFDLSADLCNTIDRVKSRTPGNDSCLYVDKRVDYDDDGNEIRSWYYVEQAMCFRMFFFTTSSDCVLPDCVKEAVKCFAFACRPPTRNVLNWIWSHATTDDPWTDIIRRKKGRLMHMEIEGVLTPVNTIFLDTNENKCRMDENLMQLAYETAISRAIFLSRFKLKL